MILLNSDNPREGVRKRGFSKNYRGRYIGDWKVLEDALDMSAKHPYRHILICKCVHCGNVIEIPATFFTYKFELYQHCECHSHQTTNFDFEYLKSKMLLFLSEERNRAQHECVFDEDRERIDKFQQVIDFINSQSLNDYFKGRNNQILLSVKYKARSKYRRGEVNANQSKGQPSRKSSKGHRDRSTE